ncbi:ACT domain-containing protein [Candidatus Micrarchaeota archaeon]|nr:ACT domain-containing protein [Candidatus Micrarchaeota archaeon]
MKPITIVCEDRVGLLADISYILAKNKINIETISVSVTAGKAVIILTVTDPKKAMEVLSRNGYPNLKENYLVVKIGDRPGELNRIAAILAKAKISISNVHLLARNGNNTMVALKVDRMRKARELLKDILAENE